MTWDFNCFEATNQMLLMGIMNMLLEFQLLQRFRVDNRFARAPFARAD